MIIDKLENIGKYVSLHPLFAEAVACVQNMDFVAHEPGRIVLREEELFVNVDQTLPKKKTDAKLETHDCFIDIQIPLSGEEIMGYTPRSDLKENAVYDKDKDITFYETSPLNYLIVHPGMFVIFFPEDAHAPAISSEGLKKIVIKVRVN